MTKAERLQVYNKYDGHCAYCGKDIEYKDMQVDHIWPQHMIKLIDVENPWDGVFYFEREVTNEESREVIRE